MQVMVFQMKEQKVVHGTTEAESNLKIALKVQNLLEQSGATVILTRSDENAIYDIDSKTLRQKKISEGGEGQLLEVFRQSPVNKGMPVMQI